MGLQFLVPAFLAGLAVLAVPVILHLTRRQRSRVVEFPSLMFLERIPYRSMRRRKIRHWLLLLVRASALVLLVAAFARPLFTDVDLAAGTVLGPREVVILLDRSYSMSHGDRWNAAIAAATEVATGLQPVDRASLIFFDEGARAATRSVSEPERLVRALEEVRVGSMGTRYGPALKLVESILADSDLPNQELFIFSDFQRAGWSGETDVRLPAHVRITPVPVGGADGDPAPENVTVADLELRRDLFSGRERVTAAARLTRVGGQEPRDIEVTLSVDGRALESAMATLGAEGAAGVTFEPFTLPGPFTRGEVSVSADGLTPDDARRFAISPGRARSVLVVRGASAGGRSTLYLERALGISRGAGYRVDVRGSGALTADLAQRSVVVLSDVPLSGPAADNLRGFLEAGGGALVVLGESSRVAPAAAGLLPATVGAPVDRLEAGRLGYVDYSHPVLETFAGPDGGDFSRARFYRYRALTPVDSARVLARYDDGQPAMVEGRVGQGRVIVWASSTDNFWNDLVLQPLFLPLLHQTVTYLTGHGPVPEAYVAGDVLDLGDPEALGLRRTDDLPTGARVEDERVALTPNGETVAIEPGTRALLDLPEHGFYQVRAPGSEEARPVTVAVNVDIEESDLRAMDPEELVLAVQAAPVADEEGQVAGGASVVRVEDLERRQGFWRFLLIGAFVLLAAETVMSNRLSRGRASETGGVRA
jgi:hypothetical protein